MPGKGRPPLIRVHKGLCCFCGSWNCYYGYFLTKSIWKMKCYGCCRHSFESENIKYFEPLFFSKNKLNIIPETYESKKVIRLKRTLNQLNKVNMPNVNTKSFGRKYRNDRFFDDDD